MYSSILLLCCIHYSAELVQKFIKFWKLNCSIWAFPLFLIVFFHKYYYINTEYYVICLFIFIFVLTYIDFGLSSLLPNRYLFLCAIFMRSRTQTRNANQWQMFRWSRINNFYRMILLSKFKSCVQSELCAIQQIGEK